MQVCLIAPAESEAGSPGHSLHLLAALLAERHEVTLVHSGHADPPPDPPANGSVREIYARPNEEIEALKFACEDHRHSAAAMATIREAYGERGPDYLEVPDFRAHGLVPLQARRGGDPLLAATTIAVRISPTTELLNLHNGMLRRPGNQWLAELEREQLRLADHLLWPGGDCLDLYRRYYRDLELPPAVRIRPPFERLHATLDPGSAEGPLRLLCLEDLQRSAGILELAEACYRSLPPDRWSLTLVGRDTPTAAMGQSMRAVLETMSGEDSRLRFEEEPGEEALAELLGGADLLVVPARLGVSSATALTAMAAGVPVLATPVGDLAEVVEDGVSGWRCEHIQADALGRALGRLEADRGELERLRGSETVQRRPKEMADPEATLDAYDELLGDKRAAAETPTEEPLVSVVVPYYRASEYVAEAVASALAQTHQRIEVLVVNDGSFEPADAVLGELSADPRVRVVTKVNQGEGTARTLGARLASGDYVVMLDSDNLLESSFVERTLQVLRDDPKLAYVTCWLRMVGSDGRDTDVHPGYAPLGNAVLSDYTENWDGDTMAMLPRSVFTELGFEFHPEGSMHSDWQLYRWLREEGHYGAVIPERLVRYRVVETSLLRSYGQGLQDRSWSESRERIRLSETRWTAEASG